MLAAAFNPWSPWCQTPEILVADPSQSTELKWAALADITSPVLRGRAIACDVAAPALVLGNTGAGHSALVNIDHQGLRQWTVGTGLPDSTNRNWSIAEYNDGTYAGMRFVLAKAGNTLIGSTTDEGSNKRQITGANITGALTLGTALSPANGGTGLASFAKGDLVVATGTAALARLAVGTDGQAPVVDSTPGHRPQMGKAGAGFLRLERDHCQRPIPHQPRLAAAEGQRLERVRVALDETDVRRPLAAVRIGSQGASWRKDRARA